MNKKDKEFLKEASKAFGDLLERQIAAIKSISPKTRDHTFVANSSEIRPRLFCEKRGFAFHDNDKVITIRCCMKCGRELAELKLIEPGEFYICETCKKRNSEYSQTFEDKLHSIIDSKACLDGDNFRVIPASKEDIEVLIHEILHAFNDETKKITSYKKWTDQDMIDFAMESAIGAMKANTAIHETFSNYKIKKNEKTT